MGNQQQVGNKTSLTAAPGGSTTEECRSHSKTDERTQKKNATKFAGLKNLGNTCYFNSILTSLFGSETVRRRLMLLDESRGENEGVCVEVRNLFREMSSTRQKVLNPKRLFSQFTKMDPDWWKPDEQHDAAEFLTALFSTLESEKDWKPRSRACSYDEFSALFGEHGCGWRSDRAALSKHAMSNSDSVVGMFEGVQMHKTRCLFCETSSGYEERILEVMVDLEHSLREGLTQIQSMEYMQERDKYFCEKCLLYQPALRSSTLLTIPRILVIHLNRCRYEGRTYGKRNSAMAFQLTLTFNSPAKGGKLNGFYYFEASPVPDVLKKLRKTHAVRIEPASDDGEEERLWQETCVEMRMERTMRLFAVVCHIGPSLFAGHYVTVVRQSGTDASTSGDFQDWDWCLVDDERVTPLSAREMRDFCAGKTEGLTTSRYLRPLLCPQNVYLLFYESVHGDRGCTARSPQPKQLS